MFAAPEAGSGWVLPGPPPIMSVWFCCVSSPSAISYGLPGSTSGVTEIRVPSVIATAEIAPSPGTSATNPPSLPSSSTTAWPEAELNRIDAFASGATLAGPCVQSRFE